MIVIDTSAVIAVLNEEPDARNFKQAMAVADVVFVSAATWVEIEIVVDRKLGPNGRRRLEKLVTGMNLSWAPVDRAYAAIAVEAHRRFGRGSGHPAKLNFGDCFAYALARALGAPLLYKGDDFVHTDILPAVSA